MQRYTFNLVSRISRRSVDVFRLVSQNFSSVAAASAATSVDETKVISSRKKKAEVKEMKFEPMNIHDAVAKIKEVSWAKFDETIEISCNMGLDPRKPNQLVKGIARLPAGTGKKIRICVFAAGQDAKDALDAGADTVGAEELIAQIQGGDFNYDTVIAAPDMMSFVGKVGKVC